MKKYTKLRTLLNDLTQNDEFLIIYRQVENAIIGLRYKKTHDDLILRDSFIWRKARPPQFLPHEIAILLQNVAMTYFLNQT